MKSKNKGIEYEQLVMDVYKTITSMDNNISNIEHNVLLDGPDGKRQIDILMTGYIAEHEIKTIIECKDHEARINVGEIDKLHSKLNDVGAQKAVCVSRSGFSEMAKKKAKRLHIDLCKVRGMNQQKWKFETQLPILVAEYRRDNGVYVHGKFTDNRNVENTIYPPSIIQEMMQDPEVMFITTQNIIDAWNNQDDLDSIVEDNSMYKFDRNFVVKKNIKFKNEDIELQLSCTALSMRITKKYYYGYLNEFESAKYIEYDKNEDKNILFDPNELLNYREKFQCYPKKESVPNNWLMEIELKYCDPEKVFSIKLDDNFSCTMGNVDELNAVDGWRKQRKIDG